MINLFLYRHPQIIPVQNPFNLQRIRLTLLSLVISPQTQAWIDNYNTEKTKEAALYSYRSLFGYLDRQDIDEKEWIESMKESDDAKYHKLSEMVNDVANYVEPASVKMYYNFWKAYLRFVHGIKIYNEDARYFVKPPKNIKRQREPLTREIIKAICDDSDETRRAEYLVLASSGMRMSEFLNSDQESFDLENKIIVIKGKLTKTKTERITFITTQAVEAIHEAGSTFWQKRTYHKEATYFHRVRERLGFTERYDDSIVHKVTLHAFRAWTRTKAGKINQDFAEALLGHAGYLSKSYVRLSKQEMLKYYARLEPSLRIY